MNPDIEQARLDRIQQRLADEYAHEIHALRHALTAAVHGDDEPMRTHWANQSLTDAPRGQQVANLREVLLGYEALATSDGLHPDPVSSLQPPALAAAQDQARADAVAGGLDLEREQRGELEPDYDDHDDFDDAAEDSAWGAIAQARRAVSGAHTSYLRAIPNDTGTGLVPLAEGGYRYLDRPDTAGDEAGDDGQGWAR